MKKFFMSALVAAAAFAAGAGEDYDLDKISAWRPVKGVTQQGESLIVNGRALLESKQAFDIRPDKVYKLEMEARNLNNAKSLVYFGFRLYAKNGKTPIWPHNVTTVNGTMTSVVKDVKKGDTVVYLKDASKWRKVSNSYLAINAKADFSDLPNFRCYYFPMKSVEKVAEGYKVTLTKPFAVNIAKGTAVRQHQTAGYMYAGGYKHLTSGKFVKMSGKVAETLKGPGFAHRSWSKYASKATVVILANWNGTGSVELKDIELEIDDKK